MLADAEKLMMELMEYQDILKEAIDKTQKQINLESEIIAVNL